MFRIIAKFPVQEGKTEEFKSIAGELVAASKKEEGIVSYSMNVSTTDPQTIAFFEVYENKDVHARHEKTPHCSMLFPKMVELMSGDPVIECFEEV